VNVDRSFVLLHGGVVVTHQLEQLGAGKDASGARGEVAQQVELGGGQADPLPITRHPPPLEVDDQIATAQRAAGLDVGQLAVGAAQQGFHAARQLAEAERLGQVVIGSDLESDHLVHLVGASGEEQDRDPGLAPDPPADLEPVDPGQTDVEQDELGRDLAEARDSLLASRNDAHCVALAFERDLDPAGNGRFVLDDHDGGGHGHRF